MNSNPIKDFNLLEVQEAILQMNPISLLEPDGISASFFQQHWDSVGKDLCETVTLALNTNRWDNAINKTFIVLIPKTKGPKDVTQFRPN